MSVFPMSDAGAMVNCVIANFSADSGAPSVVTAAGTGDNTKVTGATVNRKGAESCVLAIGWAAALTDEKTLSLAIEIQESDDDSTWDTAVVLQAATVIKTATATTNYSDVYKVKVDLKERKQYVRFNITPDLSNTATDTAEFVAVACLMGYSDTSLVDAADVSDE